jgi:hypothetical protein
VSAAEPRRPAGLLVAMLICLVMGWGGVLGGMSQIDHFRSTTGFDPPLVAGVDAREQEELVNLQKARLDVLDHFRRSKLPLAAANLLLSGLLVVGATRAMGGKKGARSLALQGLGANALLAAVDYALSQGFRGEMAAVVVQYALRGPVLQGAPELGDRLWGAAWVSFRLQLLLTLLAYAMAWAALATRASRAYLAAGEQASPDTNDDEDEDDRGR